MTEAVNRLRLEEVLVEAGAVAHARGRSQREATTSSQQTTVGAGALPATAPISRIRGPAS